MRANTAEDEEEEKRLFFVGITRAKDHLEISYYTNPDDPNVFPDASRYLSLIPEHLVHSDIGIASKETTLQTLRREIIAEREQKIEPHIQQDLFTDDKVIDELEVIRYGKHERYGVGKIVKENDNIITIIFDDYGEKEFLKAFGEIVIFSSL